jgi:hypothetical protein
VRPRVWRLPRRADHASEGRQGLDAIGSGTLAVTTAPLYTAGAEYAVRSPGGTRLVRADATGRLSFTVGLEPSHELQPYRFGPLATRGWTNSWC